MSKSNAFSILRRTSLVLAVTVALGACATKPTPVNLADNVANNPSLSTFNSLVAQAGMSETLKSGGPFTVFAPTNDAFKAVPAATLAGLGKDPAKLKDVLSYHIVPGTMMAADVKNSNVKTLQGASLALAKAGDFVIVENATVVAANLGATNGVVHTIDAVLLPPAKK
nr:fasciclin domain-containing protein [uncultured Rhodoferax sp.]